MSFIITNGTSYCHQTKSRAVQIVETKAEATKFKDELTAQKLLARATKKLKGYEVVEISGDHTKDAAPHTVEKNEGGAPAEEKKGASPAENHKREMRQESSERRTSPQKNQHHEKAGQNAGSQNHSEEEKAGQNTGNRNFSGEEKAGPDAGSRNHSEQGKKEESAPHKHTSRRGRPRKNRNADVNETQSRKTESVKTKNENSSDEKDGSENNQSSAQAASSNGDIVEREKSDVTVQNHFTRPVISVVTKHVGTPAAENSSGNQRNAAEDKKQEHGNADGRKSPRNNMREDRTQDHAHQDSTHAGRPSEHITYDQAENHSSASASDAPSAADAPIAGPSVSSVVVPKFTVVTHTSGNPSNNKKPSNAGPANVSKDVDINIPGSPREKSMSVDVNGSSGNGSGRSSSDESRLDAGTVRVLNEYREGIARNVHSKENNITEDTGQTSVETQKTSSEHSGENGDDGGHDRRRNGNRRRNHTRSRADRYRSDEISEDEISEVSASVSYAEEAGSEASPSAGPAARADGSSGREPDESEKPASSSGSQDEGRPGNISGEAASSDDDGYGSGRGRRSRRLKYGSRRRGRSRSREEFPETDETVDLTDTRDDKGHVTHPVPRRYFTQHERQMVYNSTEGHCGICGRFIPLGEYTIDHIIPLSKGGTNDLSNLQPCCSFCNKAKDDSMGDEFFERIERIYLYQAQLRYSKKKFKKFRKAIRSLKEKD